jgi:hypothetical protein
VKTPFNFLWAFVVLLAATGCASIHPVKSAPPAKSVTVLEPFEWGDGILTVFYEFPAGEYTPMYEDEGGYFYQAPRKVTGRDTFFALMKDGGLYWSKKKNKPDEVYVLSDRGIPTTVGIGDRAKLKINK